MKRTLSFAILGTLLLFGTAIRGQTPSGQQPPPAQPGAAAPTQSTPPPAAEPEAGVPLNKLVYILLGKWTGGELRVEMTLNVVLLALLAAFLIRAASRLRGRTHFADASDATPTAPAAGRVAELPGRGAGGGCPGRRHGGGALSPG